MKKRHKRTHSAWMRRTSRIYLNDINKGKNEKLLAFLNEYQRILNYCIVRFWSEGDNSADLACKSITDQIRSRFNITARLAQCAAKQAKETIRSQHEKELKRMPRIHRSVVNVDQRFITLEPSTGLFDYVMKLQSGLPKLTIPFNLSKHANKFLDDDWALSRSTRIGRNSNRIFLELIFEKECPPIRKTGDVIGIDLGLNCMLAASNGQMLGTELKSTIKRGGKRRKSWHHFIETETNRYLKQLNLDNVKLIALERLKNVKKSKRGTFPRYLNRLLSFWLYAKVGERLRQRCEILGVQISSKNPWKTSQRCPVCGNIDRRNRRGEKFKCTNCHHISNADYNAAQNLEALGLAGVYSLRSLTSC